MHDARIESARAGVVLSAFGLDCARLRPDIPLAGSPARCAARVAAEDAEGGLWVVERLEPGRAERREAIGRMLHALSRAGLAEVPAYLRSEAGGFVLGAEAEAWQVSPFVSGEPLPRPEYVEDAARGRSLARFLGRLQRLGRDLPDVSDQAFSLPAYADGLLAALASLRPELPPVLAPTFGRLRGLFEAWDGMPSALAHGDYHPLNVIWKDEAPVAVIDWEFCGPRPRLYDAANLLGCVGVEEPRALGRGLAAAFVRELRAEGVLDGEDARRLPALILGLRLAWLSEWLRHGDEEMVGMELAYLDILGEGQEALGRAWGLGGL